MYNEMLKNIITEQHMEKRRTYTVIGKKIIKNCLNKTILDDVNITIEKQSIYAVLGENSSGKSVLLRCLAGILEQDEGEVIMTNDVPVTSAESGSRRNNSNDDVVIGLESSDVGAEQTVTRRHPKIGFAPQNFDVPGPMKIYHLLHFIGAANGLIVGKIVESYKSLVPMTGLPVTTDFLVNRLRLSQKKVLSLVLAIIHDPEVIILDDITTGMDTVTLKNIWTLLTHINLSRECTIIVSASNNFCFMETAVTHVGILKNGKIIREGATTNLMEQFKTSSIEELFLAIIFAEDNLQKNPVSLKRTRRLSINNNYIPHQYTSLLSSTIMQLDESIKPKS
ncbi:Uncharacterized protein FWK35_00010776, partial [Aphis craccivora]